MKSVRGATCNNRTTASMRVTWLLLSFSFLLHCVSSTGTVEPTNSTLKNELSTESTTKVAPTSLSSTLPPTTVQTTVQTTTPTRVVKSITGPGSVTNKNSLTTTTSLPASFTEKTQITTITSDVPSVITAQSTTIPTSSSTRETSPEKTSASTSSSTPPNVPSAGSYTPQNIDIYSTTPTTTTQQTTTTINNDLRSSDRALSAFESSVATTKVPTTNVPTTNTPSLSTTATTRVLQSTVILVTPFTTTPPTLSPTTTSASKSFSTTSLSMIPTTTASTSSTGSDPSALSTFSTSTSLSTLPTSTTTLASTTEALMKTLNFNLTRGNKNKVEGDEMANVCKKLMANMQAGSCYLKWTHNKDKIQFESVEISGTVENSLAAQHYEELTKKGTDYTTLIAILTSCGALLVMIIILAICASHHRKPYNENQQHLTEELHTVENGYHDNPTLEVMEVQPEMQEKKVALNGEFNDSWIVPMDNLLKEDIPEEEDTHL